MARLLARRGQGHAARQGDLRTAILTAPGVAAVADFAHDGSTNYMMPFGGMKHSGVGRESGIDAVYEYLETKSVWISTAQDVPANPFVMR